MTFTELMNSITDLSTLQNADFFIVGYSLLGKPIFGIHLGSYEGNQILIEGAIHAREYITASLIVELVKEYSTRSFDGGMYFIPLVNPDGVELVLDGTKNIRCRKLKDFLINVNDGNCDFSLWKANANAVDLNVNFNALWGGGIQNLRCPASGNFIGYYPESEREVNSLINFTLYNKPALTISYHTRGEIIYYGFEILTEEQLARDFEIAEKLAETTGYTVEKTYGSVGGYSDWVSQELGVPAYTIEVGNNEWPHPIGEEFLPIIFRQNKEVPMVALNAVNNLKGDYYGK